MGHHLTKDHKFKSDKYPDLAEGKIILSFKDPAAREALRLFAAATKDHELAFDINVAITQIEGPNPGQEFGKSSNHSKQHNLEQLGDRYHRDPIFSMLVRLIEHSLYSGRYSIQEFREATTLAAWKIADRTIRPLDWHKPKE